MKVLFDHAQKIVNEDKPKAGLFLGTGSTKTRIALFLARGKTLVICPKTQKEDQNWEREVEKIKKLKGDFSIDLTVISKETFRRDWNKLEKFNTVIVDEADTCLGATPQVQYQNKIAYPKVSQLFQSLQDYKSKHNPERFYLATATIARSPMTIWAAGIILGYKWNFYEFRETYYVFLPDVCKRGIWKVRNDKASKRRLSELVKSIGYTGQLSDYFDVPEQTFKTIYLELTPEQTKRIKEIKIEYPDPLVQIGKRIQIENGVLAGNEFSTPESFRCAKIDTLLNLSIEFPRFIVFARYTAQIAQIATTLKKAGKKVLVMDGKSKDRQNLLHEVNTSEECVFIVQSQISAGWEVPGPTKEHPEYLDYPLMVFASKSYSLTDRIQAEGRILRANALKKNLYIDLVIKGGVDQAVDTAIKGKKDFNELIYLKNE